MSPDGSKVFVTGGAPLVSDYDYLTTAYDAASGNRLWSKTYNSAPGAIDGAGVSS